MYDKLVNSTISAADDARYYLIYRNNNKRRLSVFESNSCQGFAYHILKNSEKLRKDFVDFDGLKTWRVNCDNSEFGSPDNDWL